MNGILADHHSYQRSIHRIVSTWEPSSSEMDTEEILLPLDYMPSNYTVIVGRGKKIRDTIGNRRLRVLVSYYLPQYRSAMNDRRKKTQLVNDLVNVIYESCKCEQNGRIAPSFVRLRENRWYCVSKALARQKVGYTFRDMLGEVYRSSSKSKVAKRRERERKSTEHQRLAHFQDLFFSRGEPSHTGSKAISRDIRSDNHRILFPDLELGSFADQE